MGIISVAPFLIALPSLGANAIPRKELLEGVLALMILSALNLLVIRLPNEPWTAASAIAALLPLLLWIAARCGPVVAAAAAFICALTIVWTTTFGEGLFGDPTLPMTERVLSAQASIVAVSLCALVLASLFAERREQAAALVESEARLQSALRAGGVAAFDWQVNSGLSRRSYNSAQVLGYDPEGTLSSKSFIERIHPEDRPHFKACLYGVSRDDPSYAVTFRYRHPNEQEMWLEENGQAEFDPAGRIVRVRGLTRDITAHRRAEADLSAARKQAELANRAKSSFLSAASHELRQPLQNLSLLQSALRQRIRNGDARTLIARIGHSLGVMKGILDGLLDVNRLESGNIVPSMRDFHVNDILDSVTDDFRELIKERHLELRTVGSGARIHSDKHLLEVMIRNLLSNAVRYTQRGKILVGCRRSGDKLRIEVWDSGIGIANENLPRIFQEYYQVEDHAHSEGSGLGLAIVQRLGKTLDHPVNVRSTPGKGSCFSVELSMASTKADEADRAKLSIDHTSAPLGGAILVIEDDSLIREGLEELFNSRGLDVVSAADGNDAVALITKKNIRPDLILSDYNLPGSMDGLESINAVRTALASEIPAIVLTGDIRSQGLAAVAKQGIEIAIKPLDVDELLQLIGRLISTSGNGRSAKYLRQPERLT
jgi:PAS domain S-box-containing protein